MIKLGGGKVLAPLMNYIIVKVHEIQENKYLESKSEGGILLSGQSMTHSQESGEAEQDPLEIVMATVVAIGNTVQSVQIGDEVYFPRTLGRVLPILDGGYKQINEQNLQSRIFDDPELHN